MHAPGPHFLCSPAADAVAAAPVVLSPAQLQAWRQLAYLSDAALLALIQQGPQSAARLRPLLVQARPETAALGDDPALTALLLGNGL